MTQGLRGPAPKLTVPMILFFLPVLILGPAGIRIAEMK
jgi:hypothetical protein